MPTGTFTATGTSAAVPLRGPFNVTLYGTFVGSVRPERSFDDGTTWHPLTALGSSISFTTPVSETFEEPQHGVAYRLNCTSYTSGTIAYRIGQ